MNQLKEKPMSSHYSGIQERLKLLKNRSGSSTPLSPREVFHQKEKSLRFKMGVIFGLNNFIWILITLLPHETKPIPKSLPNEKGHEVVKLPAQIFSKEPTRKQKVHVILKHSKSSFQTSGHLRSIDDDPYGETGRRATIEIPTKDLQKLNSLTSFWLVYPYFKNKEAKAIRKRTIREVIF